MTQEKDENVLDEEYVSIQQTSAVIHIAPSIDPRIIALYEEGVSLQRYAEARIIQADSDIKVATDDLSIIARLKKAIEEKRKEYTGPINEHLHNMNDAFKRFLEPIQQADSITRQKISAYRQEQERIRVEQERINQLRMEAAQAEMKLKDELTEPVNIIPVVPALPPRYGTDSGTLGTARLWKFEIDDFSLLPDAYKVPDMIKIRKVVIAGVSIPGVRSWKEETLRVTPR